MLIDIVINATIYSQSSPTLILGPSPIPAIPVEEFCMHSIFQSMGIETCTAVNSIPKVYSMSVYWGSE